MDCIYIAPLFKTLYNLCLSFTHSHTHSHTNRDARYQPAWQEQLGLSVLLRDTSTRPGWDQTGNPPTARRQLLPPEPYRPQNNEDADSGRAGAQILQKHRDMTW